MEDEAIATPCCDPYSGDAVVPTRSAQLEQLQPTSLAGPLFTTHSNKAQAILITPWQKIGKRHFILAH